MSEETNTEQPLMQKIVQTAVLTGISALVLGFFSFFGWLGVTMIKIQDNQTKIIQDLKYKELRESKTVNVLTSELFDVKQRITQLEYSNNPFEDTIDQSDESSYDIEVPDVPEVKEEVKGDKELEKHAIEEELQRIAEQKKREQSQRKELEHYQQQIQQQRIIPPEQLK